MRVLPSDIDVALHMNNGVYFSHFDLGRLRHLRAAGLFRVMRRRGWSMVASTETIAFRKSLVLWARYQVTTEVLGVDAKNVYFRHNAVIDGEIYAQATVAIRFISRRGALDLADIFEVVGAPPAGTALPGWVSEWRSTTALPSPSKSAPFPPVA